MKDTIESVKIISVLLNNFIDELKKSTIYVDEATELKFDTWSSELKTIIDLQSKPETDDELLEFMLKNIFVENESDVSKDIFLKSLEEQRSLKDASVKELEKEFISEFQKNKAEQELAEKTKDITNEIINLLNVNPEIQKQLSCFINQAKYDNMSKKWNIVNDLAPLQSMLDSLNPDLLNEIREADSSLEVITASSKEFNREFPELKQKDSIYKKTIIPLSKRTDVEEYVRGLSISDWKKKLMIEAFMKDENQDNK